MRSGESARPKDDAGAILGLDHVTLAVPALEPAVAAYAMLFGRAADARGQAQGLGWAAFRLANTSLVLVAPDGVRDDVAREGETPGEFAAHLAGGREAGAALGALAFGVAAADAAARLLERRGLPASGPPQPWLGRPATPLAPAAARGLHLLLTPPDPSPRPADAPSLDHLVIRSGDPERSIALLAGRLGLDLRLDRSNPDWGQRLLFFRCGDLVLEVSHALGAGLTDEPDRLWGVTWRVPEVEAWRARLEAAGIPVSPLRTGRKPGTRIFTIREHAAAVPTAFIGG